MILRADSQQPAWFGVTKIWVIMPRGSAWRDCLNHSSPTALGHHCHFTFPGLSSQTTQNLKQFLVFFSSEMKSPYCHKLSTAWIRVASNCHLYEHSQHENELQVRNENWAHPLWFSPAGDTAASKKALLSTHQKPRLHSGCTKIITLCSILNSLRKTLLLTVM